jgi:hypothetical protein
MNPNDSTWYCMVCLKDSGGPTTENLPEGFEVVFFVDEDGRPAPAIVCDEHNPKKETDDR